MGSTLITKNLFSKVADAKEPSNLIAAAARIGQLQQNFADQLYTAVIPADVRTGPYAEEKVETYCDTLTNKAEPLASSSEQLFDICLQKSTELGWFSEWSKLCERELGQISASKYPTTFELRSAPVLVAPITNTEMSIVRIE